MKLPYYSLFCLGSALLMPAAGEVIISEFLASNETILADEDGAFSDWIEITNTGDAAINLEGWVLTDQEGFDVLNPETVWVFPSRLIASGERMVVFASGKNRKPEGLGELHTNFKLTAGGEYLALVQADGVTITTEFAPEYPAQESDISFGMGAEIAYVFFETPTPGAENQAGVLDFVGDTRFSVDRGFYDEPFEVVISTETLGASIIYTTDGSTPSESNGTTALAPVTIQVTTTTPVRAIAVKEGFFSSNVDTQTYIFIDDVISQGETHEGYPSTWVNDNGVGSTPADYAMDPEVTESVAYSEVIDDALLAVPTISIVTDIENLFDPTTGIYQRPQQRGSAWERPASFEVIHPDGTTEGIQVNAGLRIQGGHTRVPSKNPKHSFRLSFTSEYGPSKLNYDLFRDDPNAAEEFDQLILRGAGNQSWLHHNTFKGDNRGRAQYIRDQWAKDTQLSMGHPATRSMYAHVYINGIYWGLYNPTERGTAGFGESYLGGDKDDYFTLNSGEEIDGVGGRADYEAMIALANAGLAGAANYEQMKEALDLEAFTDYMLIQQYGGNLDWDHHNWYAFRNKNGGKWNFLCWDSEFVFISTTDNVLALNNADDPSRIWRQLLENDEYRVLFADRVQKHFHKDGLLTPDSVMMMWDRRKDQMYDAIVAESARWGDYRRDVHQRGTPTPIPLYDRDEEWQAERTRLFTTYFPVRSQNVIAQYEAAGYLLGVDPPDLSPYGGQVEAGFALSPVSLDGDIYYTIDGSDPRDEGGAINSSADKINGASVNTLVALEETDWRYLDTGNDLGASDLVVGNPAYDSSNWKHPDFNDSAWGTGQAMLGYGGITGATINQQVEYGGNFIARHITTHLRKHFTVEGASSYLELKCDVHRDDGAIVYLNGREIARTNVPDGRVEYDTLAVASIFGASESEANQFVYALSPGDLLEGNNVLAVEVHQQSAASNDLGIDVRLDGLALPPGDEINIAQSTLLKARAYRDGEWSALTEATYTVGAPAVMGNLVISEVMYHPAGEGAEFIELLNTSQETVDLSGVRFDNGIEVTIPVGTSIPAGGLFLITDFENETALANDGERITLLAADGSVIESFRYNDKAPWPTSPDGLGSSLTRVLPANDPSDPLSWRSSIEAGGTPNSVNSFEFAARDPESDTDQDGISGLLEFVFGSSDLNPNNLADLFSIDRDGPVNLSVQQNRAVSDVSMVIEHSTDLETWTPAGNELIFEGAIDQGGGISTLQFSFSENVEGLHFWRVRATQP